VIAPPVGVALDEGLCPSRSPGYFPQEEGGEALLAGLRREVEVGISRRNPEFFARDLCEAEFGKDRRRIDG
jgi:hypothetical protein